MDDGQRLVDPQRAESTSLSSTVDEGNGCFRQLCGALSVSAPRQKWVNRELSERPLRGQNRRGRAPARRDGPQSHLRAPAKASRAVITPTSMQMAAASTNGK